MYKHFLKVFCQNKTKKFQTENLNNSLRIASVFVVHSVHHDAPFDPHLEHLNKNHYKWGPL